MILDRPPPDWKRPSLTLAAKTVALLKLLKKLGYPRIHYDHRPPLSDRQFNTETNDTIPAANDPAYIEAITPKEHDERTNGPRPGEKRITTQGSDAHNRAQTRHIREREAEFRERRRIILAKDEPDRVERKKYRWPSRPFRRRET